MKLEIWNARRAADVSRWEAVHRAWAGREIFAAPAYVRLFAADHDEPLAAYAETACGFILYPFVLRPITAPHLSDGKRPAVDLTSPYGYGGAFHSGATEVDAKEFWSAFDEFCRSHGVVSEFTRLCLFEDRRLPYPGPTRQTLVNVVRDLRTPPDVMWREFDHKVRKNVNKARRPRGLAPPVSGTGRAPCYRAGTGASCRPQSAQLWNGSVHGWRRRSREHCSEPLPFLVEPERFA